MVSRLPTAQSSAMVPIRRFYVDGRWGQMHVRQAGEAIAGRPPLLMLHPTPKSGWVWEPLMPVLGERRVVIAPDTPGYGASDAPPEPASIEALAGEMLALADRCGHPGPVDVMGYHTGSVIAAAMARIAPERVRRLVLVSLPAYPAAVRAEKTERLAHFPVPKDDGSHLVAMWQLVGSLTDARADAVWRNASVAENLRSGARAPWGYRAVFAYDLEAALDALTTPTLVLNPEDDLWEQTRANVGRIADCTCVEMPGVKHGLFMLERDRITGLVDDFLSVR